jgi:hypothetical protein
MSLDLELISKFVRDMSAVGYLTLCKIEMYHFLETEAQMFSSDLQ